MKNSDIQPGTTYKNRGAGRTLRTVLAIGLEHRPVNWWGDEASPPPDDEPGVLYEQKGHQNTLFLSSFARWAGGVA